MRECALLFKCTVLQQCFSSSGRHRYILIWSELDMIRGWRFGRLGDTESRWCIGQEAVTCPLVKMRCRWWPANFAYTSKLTYVNVEPDDLETISIVLIYVTDSFNTYLFMYKLFQIIASSTSAQMDMKGITVETDFWKDEMIFLIPSKSQAVHFIYLQLEY